MMGLMTRDWARLARTIRRARESRRMTQQELATAAGVSESTVQNLEDEENSYRRRPPSLSPIARALGWTPDSPDLVLDGGDPVLREEPEAPARQTAPLPRRLQYELTAGGIVDFEVLDYSPRGGKLIVIATSPAEDDEAAAEDVREWTRMQRRIRGIVGQEGPPGPSDSS